MIFPIGLQNACSFLLFTQFSLISYMISICFAKRKALDNHVPAGGGNDDDASSDSKLILSGSVTAVNVRQRAMARGSKRKQEIMKKINLNESKGNKRKMSKSLSNSVSRSTSVTELRPRQFPTRNVEEEKMKNMIRAGAKRPARDDTMDEIKSDWGDVKPD